VSRASLEVADIFSRFGEAYRRQHALPVQQHKLMRAIECCRTANLGGHIDRCTDCSYQRISYNSCRNRHCPKCQNIARAQWVQRRKSELLPIQYFHVVFTMPEAVNALALQNQAVVYKLLFDASAQTLLTIAAEETSEPPVGFVSQSAEIKAEIKEDAPVRVAVAGQSLAMPAA
jgi:hypothetical protein